MDLNGSWEYICETSRSRLSHNKTPNHVYRFGEAIELIGVAGEIVARRFLGLSEDLHTGFDRGVDINYYGTTIDVKATIMTPHLEHRYLQWPISKNIKADIILLTAIEAITRRGTVVGFATRDEVWAAPINNGRFQPCHEIPVPKLHEPWRLFMLVMREEKCLTGRG